MTPLPPARFRAAGILFATVLLLCRCSDKALPTQPSPPTQTPTPTPPTRTLTPTPTRTPTPTVSIRTASPTPTQKDTPRPSTGTRTPTPGPAASTLIIGGTLSRTAPPAGFEHAARADMVVRNWGPHSVQLTRIETYSWYGTVAVLNDGFVPLRLAAGQTASFSVTLKAHADIGCAEGIGITVVVEDQLPNYDIFGCEVADWPF